MMPGRAPLSLGALTFAACVAVATAQAPPSMLVIRAPTAETVLQGQQTFAAEVNPSSVAVREVVFFVDGRPACAASARPFECSWDAGSLSTERTIRVVAELSNGQRLVTTTRTRASEQSALAFRTSASAIVVPVRVTDSRGRVVPGLTADRFRLLEDGVPQQVAAVLQSDAAASVLLCLDASSSMTSVLRELKQAAASFLDGLRPQDVVSLAVFNTGLHVLAGPEVSAPARRASLERIQPTGGTALFDSMIRAVDMIRVLPSPRAVVVFTDGLDGESRASAETVRAVFQANDIVLYLVVQGQSPARDSSGGRLARLAEETGGAAWFAPRISALRDQFTSIIRDLANRYVLMYSPRRPLGDDGWRRITVGINGASDDYVVRSREGYVASRRDGNGR